MLGFGEWMLVLAFADFLAIQLTWLMAGTFSRRPYDPKAPFWPSVWQGIIYPFNRLAE